jgi:hypothetical protein
MAGSGCDSECAHAFWRIGPANRRQHSRDQLHYGSHSTDVSALSSFAPRRWRPRHKRGVNSRGDRVQARPSPPVVNVQKYDRTRRDLVARSAKTDRHCNAAIVPDCTAKLDKLGASR